MYHIWELIIGSIVNAICLAFIFWGKFHLRFAPMLAFHAATMYFLLDSDYYILGVLMCAYFVTVERITPEFRLMLSSTLIVFYLLTFYILWWHRYGALIVSNAVYFGNPIFNHDFMAFWLSSIWLFSFIGVQLTHVAFFIRYTLNSNE